MSISSKGLRLGIAGLGTVGGAVLNHLETYQRQIEKKLGRAVEVKMVSARSNRELAFPFTSNPLDLARNKDIDVVLELIGGEAGVAAELVEASLSAGKHVITANKALLAKDGIRLAQLAEDRGVMLNYEAAIAGGVPIVKTLRESMFGERIYELKGILNGTSNYILCQMADLGMRFDEALSEAQRLGYAEADASFDINGDDAAHKLKLLVYLAFGIALDSIPTRGIDKIEPLDMNMAGDLSYAIRLIAQAKETEAGISASVEPVLVAMGTKLSQSSGTDNMIGILSSKRHLFLEGEGAGAQPTSASVVADIMDSARGIILPVFGERAASLRAQAVVKQDKPSAFYIRVFVEDRAGSIAAMTKIMAHHNISLSGISQPPIKNPNEVAAVVFITHPVAREGLDKAMKDLRALSQANTLKSAPLKSAPLKSAPLAIAIET